MKDLPNIKVVAVVEDGRIIRVYCDSRNLDFSVIDMDTQDTEEYKAAIDARYEIAHDNEYFEIF